MRIAVTTEDGKSISGHLGRCRQFIVYEVEDRAVKTRSLLDNRFTAHALEGEHCHGDEPGHVPGLGHHSHAGILDALSGCDVLITRGMGRRIAEDLRAAGIDAFITVQSEADSAVNAYLEGELENFSGNACGCS